MKLGLIGNKNGLRHGYCSSGNRSSEYRAWVDMKTRCQNPKNKVYPRYGGRGIKVCEKWQTFEGFLEDMGQKPEGLSIDRIDNDGDYEPGNCRWATKQQQVANRSTCIYLEFNGQKKTVTEWARDVGLSPMTLFYRVRNGWPVEKVLATPGRAS